MNKDKLYEAAINRLVSAYARAEEKKEHGDANGFFYFKGMEDAARYILRSAGSKVSTHFTEDDGGCKRIIAVEVDGVTYEEEVEEDDW